MGKTRQIIRTDLLDEIEGERFIIFEAPRGYGKTYTAKQLINGISDRICLYFTPLPWEKTFKQFAQRFVGELRRVLGNDYLQFTYTLLESETATTEIIVNRFTRELLDVRTKLQIVVDDFNLLNDEVQQFIMTMLLYVPENIDISICSRKKISYKLPRGIRRDIRIIGEEELAFSFEETAMLLTDSDKAGEIEALHTASGGWPLGLDLMMRSKIDDANTHLISSDNILELRKLFEEEIFAPQNESTQEFLLKTSLLPYFDFKLVRVLFGEEGTGLLDTLILENLFIEETNRGHYRYCQSFSNFLRSKAEDSLPANERSKFQSMAGSVLIDLNRQDEGFRFLGHSQDWGAYSLSVIENLLWFEGAITSKYRIEFGSDLPTQICEQYAGLAYLKAIYEFFQGKSEEAFRLFRLHLENPELNIDLKARFLTYSYVSTLQLNNNKWEEITINIIEEALQKIEADSDKDTVSNRLNRAILMFALSKAEFRLANYDKQYAVLEKGISLIGSIDNFIYYSIARDLLDKIDDFSDERERKLIEIIERLPDEAADIKSAFLSHLCTYYIGLGKTENIEDHLDKLDEIHKDTNLFSKIRKFTVGRDLAIFRGDIVGLLNILEQGISVLSFSPRQAMLHDWHADYILALIAVGNISKASKYFERNYGSNEKPDYPRSRVKLHIAYLILLAFDGDKQSLNQDFEILKENEIKRIKRTNAPLFEIVNIIHAYLNGEKKNLTEVNELDTRKINIAPYILSRAIKLYPDIAQLVSKNSVINEIGEKHSIQINLFGDFTVIGPKGKLKYSDFRYSKSAELFALLVVTGDESISSERVIDELWGEIDFETGKGRLDVASYNLRKDLQSIGIENAVKRQRGIIQIDNQVIIDIDTSVFDDNISNAEILLRSNDVINAFILYKKAILQYRGDFFGNIYSEWCSRWFHYYRLKYEKALEKALEISANLSYKDEFSSLVDIIAAEEDLRIQFEDKISRLSGTMELHFERNSNTKESITFHP